MMTRSAAAALTFHLAIGILFLGFFEAELHCTQSTSFRIALFDGEPHVEEAIDGPVPLVYDQRLGAGLRMYFAAALLGFVFWPPIGAMAVLRRRQTKRSWILIAAALALLILVHAAVPNAVSGERWAALNAFALVFLAVPLALLAASLRRA